MALDKAQIEALLQRAEVAGTKNFVVNALGSEADIRRRRAQELEWLIGETRKAISQADSDPAVLKQGVLDKLQTDLDLVKSLNGALVSYRNVYKPDFVYSAQECTYPLKSNKMALAIEGAIQFVQSHFEELFDKGQVPTGYTYSGLEPWQVTALGPNPSTIYGNSKSTFLQTAALTTLLVVTGKHRLQDARFGAFQDANWIDRSVMAHPTTLPEAIHLPTLDARFDRFTYAFGDPANPRAFAFVHSGFAFGGQRPEGNWYPQGKIGGPEDGSSWLRNITESACPFTTADALFYHRWKLQQGFVSPDWLEKAPEPKALEAIATPVVIRDPQRDIKPGMMYVFRDFDLSADPQMDKTLGKSGNSGIVLDFVSNGPDSSILGLGCNRDMPDIEGIGTQSVAYAKPERTMMLFSVTGNAASRAQGSTSLWLGEEFAGDKAVYQRPKIK